MSHERLSCKKRRSYGEVLGIHSPYYRTQRASTAGNSGFRTVTAHCRCVVREIVRRAKKCRKFTSIAFFLGKPHTIALIIARMAKLDVPVPVTNQHNVSGEGGQVRKCMRKYVLMALTSVRPGTTTMKHHQEWDEEGQITKKAPPWELPVKIYANLFMEATHNLFFAYHTH